MCLNAPSGDQISSTLGVYVGAAACHARALVRLATRERGPHASVQSPLMDARPIGIFDSGAGGLTVLHECLVTLPHQAFVYLGDTARCPYGPRPAAAVERV